MTDPLPSAAPAPTQLVVPVDTGERIAWLEWGAPPGAPSLLLVHGIAQTGWAWGSIARRLAGRVRILAPDLRGHGRSEAPRHGYGAESLAWDVLTVASAAGLGEAVGGTPFVLAGHGTGALVALMAASLAPASVAALALVDGGWESLADATGQSSAQYVAALAEPPEVLASLDAFLADRRAFDPVTWDEDQDRAARAQVLEKHAGHVVPATPSWALRATAEGLFELDPRSVLPTLPMPLAIVAAEPAGADDDARRERRLAIDELESARLAAGRAPARIVRLVGCGHNVMRYRPDDLAAVLLALAVDAAR